MTYYAACTKCGHCESSENPLSEHCPKCPYMRAVRKASEQDHPATAYRFVVAARDGVTIEIAAHSAWAVARLFLCAICFEFDGTSFQITQLDSPKWIVARWKAARESLEPAPNA